MKRLLWLCTHRTQWREEIPLLNDAGIEVVPVHQGHREYPHHEKPDDPYYTQSWRQHCTLPTDLLEKIRAVNWFHDAPDDVASLAREAFDGILVTSFPDTLVLLSRWFPKKIFFRVFGLAGLGSYTDMVGPERLRELSNSTSYRTGNYHWTPILPTLTHFEDRSLTQGEVVLEPFVSLERIPDRWNPNAVERYVTLVLSRVHDVKFYQDLYGRITRRFRDGSATIPLRILGQNLIAGGALQDPEVVGTCDDDKYYGTIARSSVFFYQGDSLTHLHWSVLEALAMGVPVVMLETGYLAHALRQVIGPRAFGPTFGVAEGLDDARDLLGRCLADVDFRNEIAANQRPLAQRIADRRAGANEYRKRLRAA